MDGDDEGEADAAEECVALCLNLLQRLMANHRVLILLAIAKCQYPGAQVCTFGSVLAHPKSFPKASWLCACTFRFFTKPAALSNYGFTQDCATFSPSPADEWVQLRPALSSLAQRAIAEPAAGLHKRRRHDLPDLGITVATVQAAVSDPKYMGWKNARPRSRVALVCLAMVLGNRRTHGLY